LRGKFLQGSTKGDYHVIILPGATIAKLNELILDYVQNEPVDKVVLQCGIFNLSRLVTSMATNFSIIEQTANHYNSAHVSYQFN
jgi:hypothetical protein